jgi:mannosyltransferase
VSAARRAAAGVALVAVALGLRLYQLGHEDFWIDEVFQIRVSAQPLRDIVANYRPGVTYSTLTRDQAPLSNLVYHFAVGEPADEARARLPSALFGALGVGAALAVAARLLPFGVALLAAALLAVSPLDLRYGQECRFYALWALEATLSYLALVRALDGGGRRWWFAYGVATVAGLYTCLMHGLVVVAQAVTVAGYGRLTRRGRPAAVAFIVVMLAVAAATVPVARVVLAEADRPAGTARPPTLSALPYTLFAYAVGFSLGPTVSVLHAQPHPLAVVTEHPSVAVVLVVFGSVALAGVLRLGRSSRAASVVLPWLVVPPVGVLALSLLTNITYNVRYALASLPAFLMVVAAGCLALPTRAARAVAIAVVGGCMLVSLAGYYWDEAYDREHVREALAYVRARDPDGARVVVVGQVLRALDHYARGSGVRVVGSCEETARDGGPAGQGLWVASGRDWEGRAPACLQSLAGQYRPVEHRQFVGIEVWRLVAAGG